MTKILLVSNEAARSGAPAILLGLIHWLKAHHSLEIVNVIMRDGALRADFEQTGKTYTWIPTDLNKPDKIHRRLGKVLTQRGNSDPGTWLQRILDKERPDIIYLSTLVLGKYLQDFNKLPGQRIVSHVHELLPSLLQLSNHTLVKTQLALSDSVIACAPCVANSLIQNFQLSRSKCQIIPEYINPATIAGLSENASKAKAGIKTKLDSKELEKMEQAIRRGAHVFGVGGNAIHRKGFDLFPLLVKECKQRFGPIPFHAVWIGCSEGSPGHVDLAWDLCHMGLEDCVSLIPNVPMDTFRLILRQFQVLTLLSREDPFPLVVLEAGLLEVPTVCFQGSGAIPDLADNQCCIAVDYLDLSAFAAAVHRLCLAPEERHQIGSRCRRLVEDELSLAKVGPRVAEILFGENVP